MLLILITTLLLQASEYLSKEELRLVRKGVTFELSSRNIQYNFTYDIWKDNYVFYNKNDNKSFKSPDLGMNYLRDKFKLKSLNIHEKERKKKKKRSIILFDFVSNLISNKKRIILFETP